MRKMKGSKFKFNQLKKKRKLEPPIDISVKKNINFIISSNRKQLFVYIVYHDKIHLKIIEQSKTFLNRNYQKYSCS